MVVFVFFVVVLIFLETSFLVAKSLGGKKVKDVLSKRRSLYVDSSALMDGRVLGVAQSGFISDHLFIPRSVIREMQLLADGKDSEKRARARFGLNLINELERVVYCETTVIQDPLDRTPVDERLIQLAKENHGAILTNDYNLEKVAEAEGIDVLNVNGLATYLKTEYLPGERISMRLTSRGSNPKQGVGYLQDGTMVIVENGQKQVGKDVEVEFIRFMQTPTGRMIFAKIPRKTAKKSARTKNKTRS